MAAQQTCFIITVLLVCFSSQAWSLDCFPHHCQHADSLTSCDNGNWQCQQNEYCEIHTVAGQRFINDTWHTLTCVSPLLSCLDKYHRNNRACDPNNKDHECYWCCDDAECVHNLAAGHTYQVPSAHTNAPPTTTTHTTPPPTHAPGSAADRCFNNHCGSHATFAECTAGGWLCQPNEYCEIYEHRVSNDVLDFLLGSERTFACRPDTTMADCLASYRQNPLSCDPNNHNERCHWCCDTPECVRNLAAGKSTLPPTEATVPEKTTPEPTTTKPPTTTTTSATATCYVCEGLMCLIQPTTQHCPPHSPLCYTNITDIGQNRALERGCIAASECHAPSDTCRTVESHMTEGGVCTFCCSYNNCNVPNIAIPTNGRYPAWV